MGWGGLDSLNGDDVIDVEDRGEGGGQEKSSEDDGRAVAKEWAKRELGRDDESACETC